jgi:hypothetical protein
MAETRAEFLARVADAHYAWEGEHLDEPFEPEGPDGERQDYNMWYADMTQNADAQQQFIDAVGKPDYEDDGSLPDIVPDTDAPEQPHGGG